MVATLHTIYITIPARRPPQGHPARELLVEDVHYGYLQLLGLADIPSFTIIDMSLCNLANAGQGRHPRSGADADFQGPQMCGGQQWQMDLKLQPYRGRPRGLYQADVYHNVKERPHVRYMQERPSLFHLPKKHELVCRHPWEGPTLGEVLHRIHGCCRGWRMCRFMKEEAYSPPENIYPAMGLSRSFKELPAKLKNATWIVWPYDLRRNGTLARIQQRERALGASAILNATLPFL